MKRRPTNKGTKYLLSGGGTGGHITPILAVAHEIKRLDPKAHIIYVGERGGKFANLTEGQETIDEVRTVSAGKFRRYHGQSWLSRLLDIPTNLLNIRDILLIILGTLQSIYLLRKLRPEVVFLKGGFVGVPVGLAAALWKIPYVTHDSDALPGLANRIVSRWATYHATGMPAAFYSYPEVRTRHVGVLVSESYQPVSLRDQKQLKSELKIPNDARLLLVTGGSLGARRLNISMKHIVEKLLEDYPDLVIVHQVGKGNEKTHGSFAHSRLQVLEFLQPMYRYTGAADIVVTRAGANTLAELGVQGKACIVVPNPMLTGGHQLKNAEHLLAQDAVKVVDEASFKEGAGALDTSIRELLDNDAERVRLGKNLQAISISDAARTLAKLLAESKKGA